MSYKIILKCKNKTDEEKYGRTLDINSYEAADATFKVLAKAALDDLIDPYTLEFYYGDESLRLKLEKK